MKKRPVWEDMNFITLVIPIQKLPEEMSRIIKSEDTYNV
jgi:hypothetical protein